MMAGSSMNEESIDAALLSMFSRSMLDALCCTVLPGLAGIRIAYPVGEVLYFDSESHA